MKKMVMLFILAGLLFTMQPLRAEVESVLLLPNEVEIVDLASDIRDNVYIIWQYKDEGELFFGRLTSDNKIVDKEEVLIVGALQPKRKRPHLFVSPNGRNFAVGYGVGAHKEFRVAYKLNGGAWINESVFSPAGGRMVTNPVMAIDDWGNLQGFVQNWRDGDVEAYIMYCRKFVGEGWDCTQFTTKIAEFDMPNMYVDGENGMHLMYNDVRGFHFYCYAEPQTEFRLSNVIDLSPPLNGFKPDQGQMIVDRLGNVHIALGVYRKVNETDFNYFLRKRGEENFTTVKGFWGVEEYVPEHGYEPDACVGADESGNIWVAWASCYRVYKEKTGDHIEVHRYNADTKEWSSELIKGDVNIPFNSKPSMTTTSRFNYFVYNTDRGLMLRKEPAKGLSKFNVQLTDPAQDAAVYGNKTLTAEVLGNEPVSKVEFFIDGAKVGEDASAPYQYTWDTTLLPRNTFTVKVVAYSTTGLVAEEVRSVSKTSPVGMPLNVAVTRRISKTFLKRLNYNEITWQGNATADAAKYLVYVANNGSYTLAGEVPATGNSFQHRNVVLGTKYNYVVIAVNAAGVPSDPVFKGE